MIGYVFRCKYRFFLNMFQIKIKKNAKKLQFLAIRYDFLLRMPAFYEECGQESDDEND